MEAQKIGKNIIYNKKTNVNRKIVYAVPLVVLQKNCTAHVCLTVNEILSMVHISCFYSFFLRLHAADVDVVLFHFWLLFLFLFLVIHWKSLNLNDNDFSLVFYLKLTLKSSHSHIFEIEYIHRVNTYTTHINTPLSHNTSMNWYWLVYISTIRRMHSFTYKTFRNLFYLSLKTFLPQWESKIKW